MPNINTNAQIKTYMHTTVIDFIPATKHMHPLLVFSSEEEFTIDKKKSNIIWVTNTYYLFVYNLKNGGSTYWWKNNILSQIHATDLRWYFIACVFYFFIVFNKPLQSPVAWNNNNHFVVGLQTMKDFSII